jgi:hypothetical protein
MTKSITITFNEADESLLMALFKKFKIKIETFAQQPQNADIQYKTKDDIKNDIREAVSDMHAHLRGEIELPDFFDSITRIKKELAEEEAQ